MHRRLREAGIAVRRADTFPGLDASWIRVAVRPEGTTRRLLAAGHRVHATEPNDRFRHRLTTALAGAEHLRVSADGLKELADGSGPRARPPAPNAMRAEIAAERPSHTTTDA